MIQLSKRLGSSLLLLTSLSLCLLTMNLACSNFKVSDYQIWIVLPATGECFGINVISKRETRLPKIECEKMVRRAIFVTSDTWKLMRGDIMQNCQQDQCQQLKGRFDALFIALDKGLQQMP